MFSECIVVPAAASDRVRAVVAEWLREEWREGIVSHWITTEPWQPISVMEPHAWVDAMLGRR